MGPLSGAPSRDDELRAILLLQRTRGVGDVGVGVLVERFGSASAALAAAAAGEIGRAAGAAGGRSDAEHAPGPGALAGGRPDAGIIRRVQEGLRWCGANGVTVVHRWEAVYPAALRNVQNPPAVLFLRGDVSLLDREIVTIVGSRRPTEYGRRVAREVAAVVARHGAVVASGLALGIDGEAHRSALEAGGATLAVLGAGLARPHPRSHAALFRRIGEECLLVSEFLPHELPLKHHFPQRNRTLAALARVVVVVEAAERSGALNTANHALDLGRELLSVPGPIYAPMSRGTNELLRRAHPLLTPATVLEHLAGGEALPLFPDEPPAELGADALRVWDVLADEPRHVDEVAQAARLGSGPTLAALSLLEVGGWVRQEPGARFTRSGGA